MTASPSAVVIAVEMQAAAPSGSRMPQLRKCFESRPINSASSGARYASRTILSLVAKLGETAPSLTPDLLE